MNLRSLPRPTTLLFVLCACTPAADDDGGGDAMTDKGIKTEDQGDGSFVSVVDARDEAVYKYLDLETRTEVDGDSEAWDLGFLRFNVATHVEVAVIEGAAFDAVTVAPEDGYVADANDPETSMKETMPGYAFDLWYDYNHTTHVLTARTDLVYVVHTPEDNYFKVQMLDYYDPAGTSGYLSLRWAPLAPPA